MNILYSWSHDGVFVITAARERSGSCSATWSVIKMNLMYTQRWLGFCSVTTDPALSRWIQPL